jgi:hypothetical protein
MSHRHLAAGIVAAAVIAGTTTGIAVASTTGGNPPAKTPVPAPVSKTPIPTTKKPAPATPDPQMITSLARALGIDPVRARHVLALLNQMDDQQQSRDPNQAPALDAAARYLGLTPGQLVAKLTAWKISFHH